MFRIVDRRQPIDILDTCNKASVVRWLSALPERGRIEVVAMDMSSTFRAAVRAVMPDVPIVAAKKAAFRGRHVLLKRPKRLTVEQAFKLDRMLADNSDLAGA
jgi:transposase